MSTTNSPTDSIELRRVARELLNHGLRAVDARAAVRNAVRLENSRLRVCDAELDLATSSGIYVVAIGKAALAMSAGLTDVLGDRIVAGVISGPASPKIDDRESLLPVPERCQCFAGGHPLPNEQSLLAAQAAITLLKQADSERALVIFLISGGGSAMIEWPRDERITLNDLREANRALVSCGATIAEINSVRRSFSAIKGGGLAAFAPHAAQLTLIISDTNQGDEASVASGPTLLAPTDTPAAAEVIARYDLTARLPKSIAQFVRESITSDQIVSGAALRHHRVLLDNQSALDAIAETARALGLHVEIAGDVIEQPIEEGCLQLLARLEALRRRAPPDQKVVCVISGGEFACPVRGPGIGGRNAETVLRLAIEIDARRSKERSANSHVVVLSGGTDGIDGNSPAAGAIADETTIMRESEFGVNALRSLEGSNAFSFFDRLSDTISIGPTGTNVRDVRIMLAVTG